MDLMEFTPTNYLETHRFKINKESSEKIKALRTILDKDECVVGGVVYGSHTYELENSNSDLDSIIFIDDNTLPDKVEGLKLSLSASFKETEKKGIRLKKISNDIVNKQVDSLIYYFSQDISKRDPNNFPYTLLPDLFLMQIGSKKIDQYRKIVLDKIGEANCGDDIWNKYLSSELLVIFNKNNRLGNSEKYNRFVEKRSNIMPTSVKEARSYFGL